MNKVRRSMVEENQREYRSNQLFTGLCALFVALMFLVFFLFGEVYMSVVVHGPSMQPTFYTGDKLIVNTYKAPDYGDVVIINHGGTWLIKRVVGLEGDVIKICDGKVYRNGEELNEKYLAPNTITESIMWTYLEVGEDQILYLGDNRMDSMDSRSYGTCKIGDIRGVVANWSYKCENLNSIVQNLFYSKRNKKGN